MVKIVIIQDFDLMIYNSCAGFLLDLGWLMTKYMLWVFVLNWVYVAIFEISSGYEDFSFLASLYNRCVTSIYYQLNWNFNIYHRWFCECTAPGIHALQFLKMCRALLFDKIKFIYA